ncbi:MAG TPA: S-layer homology domain-containing protein, partial [Clostridiaceae bacterium]|nr:S-layer homology domain-containing protein [Clostridiaceae bacterium]
VNVVPFTDEAEISGYAKEAVAAIQKAGIIKGTGDGRFAPKNNATRAEAAVIIYRLLNRTF